MTRLPEPGEIFEEKYRIEAAIGRGGFAQVYRAEEMRTRRLVAIKILTLGDSETASRDRVLARFEREARLLASLKSAHSVTMYEFGQSSDGLFYLVFEYVDGKTLQQLIEEEGALPPARVVSILEQVLTAIGEAHQLGVLHRDIKPANVMVFQHLGRRDLVKLLDFGIAKSMERADVSQDDASTVDASITIEGAMVGTPRYMAPEQIANQTLTAGCDIFSLGLVAYELLVGDPAIGARTTTGIIREQLSPAEIVWPTSPTIPAGLRRLIGTMTRKRREERYNSVEEVLADLPSWREADLQSSLGRWAVAGMLAGIVLIVAAFILPRERPAAPLAEPVLPTSMGFLGVKIRLDDADLTYLWLKSSQKFELRGTRDPLEIPSVALAVVAIEKDEFPVPSGERWVADLSEWDRESTDFQVWAELVSEDEFRMRADAAMNGVRVGRNIGRNGVAEVIERYLNELPGP